jgi:DNA phosphorothioation-dependent restriction protein DptH
MNTLVEALAQIIREKVTKTSTGVEGSHESRFIFHGPPLALLEGVFQELTSDASPRVSDWDGGVRNGPPILLQLPPGQAVGPNPDIGKSGRCDENHLLHIRNDPNSPSFVALMPPGQHNNRSVASTTEEFGIRSSSNTGHATFDEWWEDEFVQRLVSQGLHSAGFGDDAIDIARQIVGHAASAIDEVDRHESNRMGAWRLLSRIYSIPRCRGSMPIGESLALACGVPPMNDGRVASAASLRILERLADEMADGFKTGIDRIAAEADETSSNALRDFLSHVQSVCEIPTAFERATPAFYLPNDALVIEPPPTWWSTLTTECWTLLLEEPDDATGDLSITCTNAIVPVNRGMPAVVRGEVTLAIAVAGQKRNTPVEVNLTGGSQGRVAAQLQVLTAASRCDVPPVAGQKTPITYKVAAENYKSATARVVSLATWIPGILVTCRTARKLSPPKKARNRNTGANWETSFTLPGAGRYELLLFLASGSTITRAVGITEDANEGLDEGRQDLQIHVTGNGDCQVEVEADGQYQLEVTFQPAGRTGTEVCKAYITCEEAQEEGCRSEFERLIKLNRRQLEKFDTKAVVQLDRHARLSSMQAWMLDEQLVAKSFVPIVLSDDYSAKWATPDWDSRHGPILSQARFLHDPRPESTSFQPPNGFVEARQKIAAWIRNTSDQAGLVESAPLGKWLAQEPSFRTIVEAYLDAYMSWLASDRDIACWVDVLAVCPREADGRTLARIPDAIILSPLHPLRFAWHCLAQQVLFDEVEGVDGCPCPASSILDPACVPDLLVMSLQSPGGPTGIDRVGFLSVECNSDYWSVLWNGSRLSQIAQKSRQAPFDSAFGLVVGGISSGFSPSQVARALEDVSDLLAAKPILSLVVSSAGGATDACNEGLANWCAKRFGIGDKVTTRHSGAGPRILEIFDTRPSDSRPDQAAIANLSEDTGNHVRWFDKQPPGTHPDLGIIAQLDSAQPESTEVGMRSPLGLGGLIRHRVRRQLHGAFISESRQGIPIGPSGDVLADKVTSCIVAIEGGHDGSIGLQFAPNVHAVANMLEEKKATFVAVSSSAIDPACFLGGWIQGTYLWDYDLPAYSQRAGDTSGYYLLSQVRDADREALGRVLDPIPGCRNLEPKQVEQILLEVARRGIPTVRGLSGDDTGATGDLGLFLAVRLLQDQFRVSGNANSLLPVLAGSPEDASIAMIIPVDPFRGYLSDLARSLGRERKDAVLSRPDLLVVGIHAREKKIRIHLTPVEVKCRQGSTFGAGDAKDALGQAKSLSILLRAIEARSTTSRVWKLAYQHLLLSMIGFGLRVYSQHELVVKFSSRWAGYHERIAAEILDPNSSITVDGHGRLIVVDSSPHSEPRDHDGDGFSESIFISPTDAGRIIAGDAQGFYDVVRSKIGTWRLFPTLGQVSEQDASQPIDTEQVGQVSRPNGATAMPVLIVAKKTDKTYNALDALAEPTSLAASPDASGDLHTTEPECKGVVLSVGRSVDGFEPRSLSLNISDTRLNQLNIGVVGDLGTGKTQLLKSLIYQIAMAREDNRGTKPRILIFDYKRDYSSAEFVAATGARIVRPTRLPLNLFDTTSMGESVAPWLDRFRFFTDVLDKVYSGIGPVQRDKLKGAVRIAYESCSLQGRQPTIYDIHAEYRALLGGKSDSPMAIIDDLVDMEVFEKDPAKTKPFNEFFDGIVVISLDAMGQDDRSKNMLVAIMLNMFYENMLKTPKRPFVGSDPQLRVIDSYLLVDEADNIMRYEFDVLRKLLLQGREFGAGVILASQYLRHFKTSGTDYREPLLTWFIHKVPNVAAAELGALGYTSDLGELAERVKTLPNHHCLYKSFDIVGEVIRGLPFYELAKAQPEVAIQAPA